MRRICSLILAFLLTLGSTACSSGDASATTLAPAAEPAASESPSEPATVAPSQPEDQTELVVFAAASMTETLEQITKLYKEAAPNVTLTFNFDSSGTLKTQIQEGADCDIFISAGQKQMDQLDVTADASVNTEGLDFVLQGTRTNLLENKVTLCVPEGNPAGVGSFDNVADKLKNEDILFAMGNSDMPVGQYTQKILDFYKLDEAVLAGSGKITYGTNVKEVTAQISESSVSCGVVYCTDAYSAGLAIVDYATAEMCGQVIYPAAVLNISKNPDVAKAFMDYIKTTEAMAVFENVGFAAA